MITTNNGLVTWDVDDTRLATYDASALTMGGNNIALGVSDVNATTTRHPSLTFTVFDNLVVSSVSNGLPGNFDNNAVVDAADYVVWRKALGQPTEAALNGHGDNQNGVDQGDYTLWRANFGAPSGTGVSFGEAVPEPGALLLLVVGLACGCGSARRRS